MKKPELGKLSIRDFELGGWYNPMPYDHPDSELKWLGEDLTNTDEEV